MASIATILLVDSNLKLGIGRVRMFKIGGLVMMALFGLLTLRAFMHDLVFLVLMTLYLLIDRLTVYNVL